MVEASQTRSVWLAMGWNTAQVQPSRRRIVMDWDWSSVDLTHAFNLALEHQNYLQRTRLRACPSMFVSTRSGLSFAAKKYYSQPEGSSRPRTTGSTRSRSVPASLFELALFSLGPQYLV
ncbi:hypothetical protein C8R47DRAFT_1195221 [Mycena vitilis]|nr:hypothetical protein C8R47DRAFT_1195221 [Mycena vitilis]